MKFLITPSSNKIFTPKSAWSILSLSLNVLYIRTCSNLPMSCNNAINSASKVCSSFSFKSSAILFATSTVLYVCFIFISILGFVISYGFTYSENAILAFFISIIFITFCYYIINILRILKTFKQGLSAKLFKNKILEKLKQESKSQVK